MAYTLEDEFGDIIGKARRGNGLSVDEVAAGAGITEAQLSQMEDYTLKPTEDQVHKIAECLNLNGARLADIAMERWDPNRSHRDTTTLWRSSPSQQMSVDGPSMPTYLCAKRPMRLPSSTPLRTQTMCCRRWKKPASSRLRSC